MILITTKLCNIGIDSKIAACKNNEKEKVKTSQSYTVACFVCLLQSSSSRRILVRTILQQFGGSEI